MCNLMGTELQVTPLNSVDGDQRPLQAPGRSHLLDTPSYRWTDPPMGCWSMDSGRTCERADAAGRRVSKQIQQRQLSNQALRSLDRATFLSRVTSGGKLLQQRSM